jgi:DNA-binding MarR family transcriptional regulator
MESCEANADSQVFRLRRTQELAMLHQSHIIRDTSLEAHDYVQQSGRATTQEQNILTLFNDNLHLTFTRREVAAALHMETSTVAARINSLVKAGALEEKPRRKCNISGINAIALRLPTEQGELFA